MLATLIAFAQDVEQELEADLSDGEVVNPVLPDTSELLWAAVFFFLLLIFMWKVCLPPIKKAMRQRDDQVQADREAAERARTDAEQVKRDYDATLAEARADATRIIDEARTAADARRSEIVGAVETELAEARTVAMAEIDAQRAAALSSLRGDVGGIATDAASAVVQRDLDQAAQSAVVDTYLSDAIESR